ncbi:hypothetical protein YA0089_28340 [Pseudomonas viridiflava]|uniref:hypothetical protein n=1 Tax=Pseudomonas viridiflava TaxID=33069 RepID=UPI0018E5EF43|nr:hypothetical protein [Pseudomonas viridiflava]MBI6727529.1 hypothetical protein [Pseudomonas viridiflava]
MTHTFIGEQFRNEVQRSFSLTNLRKGRKPIEMTEFSVTRTDFKRINNFMVKLKHSLEVNLPDWIGHDIREFINVCIQSAHENGLPVRKRFVYLTVDTKPLSKGQTLRNPGWHLDGLQGSEIPFKQPACFEFIWSNKLPIQYSNQGFEIDGLNFLNHNVFDSLGDQVYDESVEITKENHIYLINAYQMYRSTPAQADCSDNVFLRLHFSELPITSKTMTLNDQITYPYPVHSTKGTIPEGLVIWEPENTTP